MRNSVALLVLLLPSVALADKTAQREQIAREQIAPKIDLMCGIHMSVRYDHESLAEVDVGTMCEEPLRFLYYACQQAGAREKVKLARLQSYECRGSTTVDGALTLDHGKLTFAATDLGDATEDRLTELSKILHLGLEPWDLGMRGRLRSNSRDLKWEAFVAAPVPTNTDSDCCIVDGKKGPLPPTGDPLAPPHVAVKCVHGGKVVTDMTADGDGFFTRLDGEATRFETFRHGVRHGESWLRRNGVVLHRELYDAGTKVWASDYYADGKLHAHFTFSGITGSRVTFDEHEGVLDLVCGEFAASDPVLRVWCGFDRPRKVKITDPGNPRTVIMTNGKARIAE